MMKKMSRGYIHVLFVSQFDSLTRFTAFLEHLAHMSDSWKYNQVHAELIIFNTAYAAVCNKSSPKNCILKYEFKLIKKLPFVNFVDIPVKNMEAVSELAESIWKNCRASYRIPFTDLAMPSFLVHDLDDDPKHWDHLYCSQFVLLFLRICAEKDLLDIPVSQLQLLDEKHCNSVTCTPAHLKITLDRLLQVHHT